MKKYMKKETYLQQMFEFFKEQGVETLKDYSDYNDFRMKNYGERKEELANWLETLPVSEQKDFKDLFNKWEKKELWKAK